MGLLSIYSAPVGSAWYTQAVALRDAVLRRPLGLRLTAEELALDTAREHRVAVRNHQVVGSISFYLQEPTLLRVKQMAVDPAAQGQGIGGMLMQAAETRGRELGAQKVLLHARGTAQAFYARQGYCIEGEEFLEQGIAHVTMVKPLPSPV